MPPQASSRSRVERLQNALAHDERLDQRREIRRQTQLMAAQDVQELAQRVPERHVVERNVDKLLEQSLDIAC